MTIKVHGQQRCGVNTKFEQDLSLLPKGQFTPAPREGRGTETRQPLVSVAVAAIAALIVVTLSIWYFWPTETLLARLPADVNLYFSLSLPAEEHWYNKLIWWRQDELLPKPAGEMFSQLAKSNWQWRGINFSELTSISRGKAEAAQLVDGTWIFALDLKEPKELERSTPLAGFTRVQIGRRYYLSDRSDFWEKIRNRPKPSLDKINRHLGRGAASIYLKDPSVLAELGHPVLLLAENFLTYPFSAGAKTSSQGLIWQEFSQKGRLSTPFQNSFGTGSSRALALSITTPPPEAALVWQFADLGAVINRGLFYFSQENKELLQKFYNFTSADIASKFAGRDGLFILLDISGPNWILLVREDGPTAPNQEILGAIKGLAVSFFAATHPKAVEHRLADGSKMVELRAEIGGIDGQSFIREFQGRGYEFWGLSGQGENTGYFVGFLPERGYIFTTNLRLLDLLFPVNRSAENTGKDCFKGKKMAQAAWLSPKLINDALRDEAIKIIGFGESGDGQLAGCLLF